MDVATMFKLSGATMMERYFTPATNMPAMGQMRRAGECVQYPLNVAQSAHSNQRHGKR